MKRSCLNEGVLGLLNKDIVIDVLSRLPVKTLIRLSCVSKGLRRLVSDPDFILVYMKRMEPISGLFFQERFRLCDDDIERHSYVQFGVQGAKVHQMLLDFLPEKVVLLATSNGLLCCRSCMPSPIPSIYICNPVNKDWIRVNWDAPNKKDSIAFAFDPASPRDMKTSLYFELVQVHHHVGRCETDDAYFSFHIYSSPSRAWVKSTEICRCEYKLCKNRATFAGGCLYWMTESDQVLMFDVKNELSCLISLPLPATEDNVPEKCIGESSGKLHCVTISQDGVVVWVLEEHYESRWVLTWSITLETLEEENNRYLYNLAERVEKQSIDVFFPWMKPLAFEDGLLVLLVSLDVYLYHIHDKKLEKLCSLAELGRHSMMGPTVLLHSLSLVPVSQP
ncbi:hypothetical protein Dimus_027392 [Dionaea muscipula]